MKLRRALAILALLAVAILPVAAAPVVVTGDITTGFIYDLSATAAQGYVGTVNLYAKAAVDDFTSAYVQIGRALEARLATVGATALTYGENIYLVGAYLTTDITKYFKVDPKMALETVKFGYSSAADAGYGSVTAYGSEGVHAAATGTGWVLVSDTKLLDIINVRFGIDNLSAGLTTKNDWTAGVFVSQNLGFGTLNAEAFYDQNLKTNIGSGFVTADFNLAIAMGDMTITPCAGIYYDLDAAAVAATPNLKYGAGAKFALAKPISVVAAAGLLGTSAFAVDTVAINADIGPIDLFEFLIGAKLDLKSTATTPLNVVDVAAKFHLGVADFFLGYLYTTNGGAVLWAPLTQTNGGVYAKAYVAF